MGLKQDTVDLLYHVSDVPGLREFRPRSYWHVAYVLSGPLTPGTLLPAGLIVGSQGVA